MSRKICRIIQVAPVHTWRRSLIISFNIKSIYHTSLNICLDKEYRKGIIKQTANAMPKRRFTDEFRKSQVSPTICNEKNRTRQCEHRDGARRQIRGQRFFRPGGSGSGSIRNAAKRTDEGANSSCRRRGIWCLPRNFLPGTDIVRSGRHFWIDPQKERSTPRPQTDQGDYEFYRGPVKERPGPPFGRTCGVGQQTVSVLRASSKCRASTCAQEKKTSVAETITTALRQVDNQDLVSHYERVRQEVTSTVSTTQSMGQQLFCQRGLALWLTEWCVTKQPIKRSSRTSVKPPPMPNFAAEALTTIFASMFTQLIHNGDNP